MTLEEIIAADERGSCFAIANWDGIAWHFSGPELEDEWDEETGENVTEWTGEQIPTGKVLMVMVGDDRRFTIDPEDVTELADGTFCYGCGQIGCGHDTDR